MSLFTIVDATGRYVDRNSIRYSEETRKWKYISKRDYRYDRDSPRDTGRHLYSINKANEVVDYLKRNLHKVNMQTDFTIIKIN